jgi:SAM-dependent MidA family methyltransferase
MTSVFSQPGKVDLSADVDFSWLRDALGSQAPSVKVLGPTNQATFLSQMGIEARLAMLLRSTPPSRHADIISGYKRLVDTTPGIGMGSVYKCMVALDNDKEVVGFM